MTLIKVLIGSKKLEDAVSHLNNYLKRNPKDQEAWYLLGKTHLTLSEDALKMINEIDPNSVIAHEISGEIDASMHNYDVALVEFKKAVDMARRSQARTCTWARRFGVSANGNRHKRNSRRAEQ